MSDLPEKPPVQPYEAGDAESGEGIETDPEARQWAMIAHLTGLAVFTAIPLASVLGPLVVWLIKKDEYPFVDHQGKEALNFNISMFIYMLIGAATLCVGVGALLMAAVAVVQLVFIIIAAIQANQGKAYQYPLTIRLVT